MSDTQPKKLLKSSEVMDRLSIGRTTFWKLLKSKSFPEPRVIGRGNRWLESDIDRYIAGTANQTTTP